MSNEKQTNGLYRIPDLIVKKREGMPLTKNEINFFVRSVVSGHIQESQLGAMLMAIFLKKLNDEEITNLTRDMMNSGDVLEWPEDIQDVLVDKHSTGGVGDKISLVLAPALAACGMKVPMISGRGLSHTGGTLDKLEAIPGFSAHINPGRMKEIIANVGCCIVGQTEKLCPADKKIYAVRDVTGTVDDTGLIAASIISKKAAENLRALVLDVKCGEGSLIKDAESACRLARVMVAIGNGLGIHTVAAITRMDNPIGAMIGNALEVAEAITCLNGNGPEDIMELVVYLGAQVLFPNKKAHSQEEAKQLIRDSIENGSALEKFREMIIEQGVAKETADKLCKKGSDVWSVLPRANTITEIRCEKEGKVKGIQALKCAELSGRLGAGRAKSSDILNYAVGLELCVNVGDSVNKGDTWLKIHHDTPVPADLLDTVQTIITIVPSSENVERRSRIIKRIPEADNSK